MVLVLDDESRRLFIFRGNRDGQLGLGNFGRETNRNVPTQATIPGDIKIKAVGVGDNHTAIITENR